MIELFDTILSHVPVGAVIAGGAVRDYVVGVPHRDIDVFVPYHEDHNLTWRERVNDPRWRWTTNPNNGWIYDEAYAQNLNRGVFEYDQLVDDIINSVSQYSFQDNTVQVIVLSPRRTIQQHLDSFDMGICQAVYANGGIQLSNAFLSDWKSQTITPINPNARTPDRAARLITRLPGFWSINQGNNIE